jgi:hypothetical protein
VVSFTFRPLYPRSKSPQYPLEEGCVDDRAGLEGLVERKILSLVIGHTLFKPQSSADSACNGSVLIHPGDRTRAICSGGKTRFSTPLIIFHVERNKRTACGFQHYIHM